MLYTPPILNTHTSNVQQPCYTHDKSLIHLRCLDAHTSDVQQPGFTHPRGTATLSERSRAVGVLLCERRKKKEKGRRKATTRKDTRVKTEEKYILIKS